MRLSKEITLYLPTNFKSELDNYLLLNPPKFIYKNDQFYYLAHYLILKQIKNPKKEYLLLNEKNIKAVIGSNINRYIKILKNGEFIISDEKKEQKIKSLWYKLNIKKNDTTVQKVIINNNSKLSKKIVKRLRLNRTHNNRLEPFLRLMNDKFMKLELDYLGAYKWVDNNAETTAKLLSYTTSLKQIEDNRFRYFKRNKTNNRLDTNFTNLKSDLRVFFKEKFVSIDLKNSQPLLLGILLKELLINNNSTLCMYFTPSYLYQTFGIKGLKAISKIRQKQEKAKMATLSIYLNSVLNGVFYDEFMNLYSENITRDEVKDIMFKVLFSKNQSGSGYKKFIPYEKEKIIFEEVYPLVYEIVKILKNKDNKILPIYLQKLESYIFIDCIAKELTENNIIPLTIHDSIIVEPKYIKKTIEIMNKVFLKELWVIPSFDIKPLYNEKKSICPITGLFLNKEKEDANYVRTSTLKHLKKNNLNKFIEVCSFLLSDTNGNRPKFENNIITHLAKQVRNRYYSKSLYRQTGYNQKKYSNQIKLNI